MLLSSSRLKLWAVLCFCFLLNPAWADETVPLLKKPLCPQGETLSLPKDLAKAAARVALVQSGDHLGSGVIISSKGLLLTASHVLHGEDEVVVYVPQKEAMQGKLLRLYKKYDLALIQIPANDLGCLPLADALPPLKSEVFILGFQPGEEIRPVVSEAEVEGISSSREDGTYIHTALNLTSGNSGGPILNREGEIVGIVSVKIRRHPFWKFRQQVQSLGVSTLFLTK